MSYSYVKYAEQLAERIAAELLSRDSDVSIESPIERIFFNCFFVSSRSDPDFDIDLSILSGTGVLGERGNVFIGRQVRVLDWPVDFLIVTRSVFGDQTEARLVVECDGHEFHERTKEQAARDRSRDRALQASGHTVMRFTGSELYRDPMGCVLEVMHWCQNHVWDLK